MIVLLLCFEMKHIHSFFASNLFSLIFPRIILIASNELTGSIPTEFGLLTELTKTDLGKWLFFVLLVGFGTKCTRSLLLTMFLWLIFNPIVTGNNKFTGSIPTEVGLLTELTDLRLCKRLFSVLLVCFETKHIRSLLLTRSFLFSLILFW